MKQHMNGYTAADAWVWKTLFNRQEKQLKKLASQSYLEGIRRMEPVLNGQEIPDFNKINHWFAAATGWQIEVVPGLIPVDDFFALLAEKKFSASTWLRSPENLDYLEEPDMFHDIFGHIPLLSDPVFSNFAQEVGRLGVALKNKEQSILALQRLYWFTIEFGLIEEKKELKIYGAGIISSFGETSRAVSDDVNHIPFDMKNVLHKTFRTDVMQKDYVVIKSFDDLTESLQQVKQYLINQELSVGTIL